MFCAGRLLAEGTFESHHVQVVFTGGTHISPLFGGGVFVGGVQTPFTTVLGAWQVGGGGGGGVQTPLTKVSGALQVGGGGVTGGVQTPLTKVFGALQVGGGGVVTGGVQTPFTSLLGALQVGAGEPGSVPFPIRPISVESKLRLRRLRPLPLFDTKLTSSVFRTIPLLRGAKVTLKVALLPGSKDKGRLGPLTSNDLPCASARTIVTLALLEFLMTAGLVMRFDTATLPKLINDGLVPTVCA
jgi:hypothetical protein